MTTAELLRICHAATLIAALAVITGAMLAGIAFPALREAVSCGSVVVIVCAALGAWYVWDVLHPVGERE
jgi:hypothetical protein